MTILNDVRRAMVDARGPWYAKDHDGCGFYAIYIKSNCNLPAIEVPEDGLLYIGMTRRGFSQRDHFNPRSGHSGSCTFRRSLGVLLKEQLSLEARPRSRQSAGYHFRFDIRGEQALSEWMKGSLYLARVPFGENVELAERQLIRAFEPPLNLRGWANPQSYLIERLRAKSASEARAFAKRTQEAA